MENLISQVGDWFTSSIGNVKDTSFFIIVAVVCFMGCRLFSRVIRRVIRTGIILITSIAMAMNICSVSPDSIFGGSLPLTDGLSSVITSGYDKVKDFFGGETNEKPTEDTIRTEVDGKSTIHFIDVGQADCILIENGEDVVLIDCGNYADIDTVTTYLDGLGIQKIDYFIATHPHEDHIGCAANILKLYDVNILIKPEANNDTVCYTKMMENVEKYNTEVEIPTPGDTYSIRDASFQILGPISKNDDELNNNSIVIRYVYGDTSFLFMGDAEREEEQAILEQGFILDSDVIKVGHHGSKSSSSYPWIREVMPQYAVIQVGAENSYGHPHDDVLSKYRDSDTTLYRTDESGTIVMTTDGQKIEVFCEK